jgi:uncharacterized protein YndB with AHSA1/START domain
MVETAGIGDYNHSMQIVLNTNVRGPSSGKVLPSRVLIQRYKMTIAFDLEQTIEASPEDVFAVLTDLDAAGEWMPNLVGIDVLTDQEFGVGTRWRETRKMFGREASEHFEVTACERPTEVGIYVDGKKGDSGNVEYRFVYTLEADGDDATHLTLSSELSGMGFFGRLMFKLFGGSFKKAIRKDLDAMKEHIEASS